MALNLSLALILTAAWLNASQTFIISYRAQIKNAVVISESYQFSKSMRGVKAKKAEEIFLECEHNTNIDTLMHTHKDEILEFLMRHGAHTRSHEKVSAAKSSSLLSLSLPPSYITVDFNDGLAIITRLVTE
jgi:hypothetical protein